MIDFNDLDDVEAAQSVKLVGSEPDGTETDPVASTEQRLHVEIDHPKTRKKYEVYHNDNNINLRNNTYIEVYRYDGTGTFFGMTLDFDSTNVWHKLEVDGVIVYEGRQQDLDNFGNGNVNADRYMWTGSNQKFNFYPPVGLMFGSSIVISASSTNNTDRTLERHRVHILKD